VHPGDDGTIASIRVSPDLPVSDKDVAQLLDQIDVLKAAVRKQFT
jgi:hypothetical protein